MIRGYYSDKVCKGVEKKFVTFFLITGYALDCV